MNLRVLKGKHNKFINPENYNHVHERKFYNWKTKEGYFVYFHVNSKKSVDQIKERNQYDTKLRITFWTQGKLIE